MEQERSTIEVRAFATDEAFIQTLEERAVEILARVEAEPGVEAAVGRHRIAAGRVAELREARQRLTRRGRELFDLLRETSAGIELSLIAGDGRDEQSRGFVRALKLEAEHRLSGQAVSRVVEQMLPEAEIAELGERAEASMARAAALRSVVEERIRRTALLMAQAADHEGEIVFDQGKTLSGELRAKAESLEAEAMGYRREAEERRIEHLNLLRRLDSFAALRS